MTSQQVDFWSTREVLAFLDISRPTLERKVRNGQIPPPAMRSGKGRGGERYWRADDIRRIQQNKERMRCGPREIEMAHELHTLLVSMAELDVAAPGYQLVEDPEGDAVHIDIDKGGWVEVIAIGAPGWAARQSDGQWASLPPARECLAYMYFRRPGKRRGGPPE